MRSSAEIHLLVSRDPLRLRRHAGQGFKAGSQTCIPKGIYRFKSFEEANRQDLDCLVKGMAKIAADRA